MTDEKASYSPVNFRVAAAVLQEQFKNHTPYGAVQELNSWSAVDLKDLMSKVGQDYKTIGRDLSKELLKDLVLCFVFYCRPLNGLQDKWKLVMLKYNLS